MNKNLVFLYHFYRCYNQNRQTEKAGEDVNLKKAKPCGKLPLISTLSYSASNIGTAFSWGFITSYFMMFCTDAAGIPAAVCSIVLLVSRLFDGITDPMMGYLADRKTYKHGRYLHWVAIFAVPVAVTTCMLFYVNPTWSLTLKVVWVIMIYFIYLLMFTGFSVPLDALPSVMTPSPEERAKILSVKSASGILGITIVAKIATEYFEKYGTDNPKAYFNLTIIFLLISLPLYFLTPVFCKEKIIPDQGKNTSVTVKDTIRQNIHSAPFVIAFFGHLLNGLISYGRVSVFVYYFKYVAEDMSIFATFILLMRIPQIFGAYVAQYLLKVINKPGRALSLLYIIYGLSLIANFFVLPVGGTLILFYVMTGVSSFLFGITYSLVYIIIPDIVDYSEYKNHTRNDAGIAALLEFGNKVGMAVGTSMMGFVLQALGYTANVSQTQGVVTGINSLMFIFPGAIAIAIGIMFVFYKLDRTHLHVVEKDVKESE